ncbi:MAG: (Fe-S)-binding protein [Defluviitaleaceae bacterium]|nr:(Fe-S)-binding protein [Defluviitaleaceae bacterium]
MQKIYFNPGCALSIYKPEMEQKILHYLNMYYDNNVEVHKICCRYEPKVENGSVVVNVCAGCDRRFSSLYEGVSTISLWEVLDKMNGFHFPNYSGIKMSVHDACPVREKTGVHLAVRSLLHKMNIEVVETEHNRTNSICCGDDFYPKLPLEKVHEHMKKRANSMPCEDVVVYCVSCIKSMFIGEKNPRYMVDLLFNETTTAGVYDTIEWHKQLQEYIENHKF